jgi:hypothetical protein
MHERAHSNEVGHLFQRPRKSVRLEIRTPVRLRLEQVSDMNYNPCPTWRAVRTKQNGPTCRSQCVRNFRQFCEPGPICPAVQRFPTR